MIIDPKEANVIVVEDNADNLFIITDILQEEVGVHYCNGRASGWQLFKLLETNLKLPIHLILLDLQIPHEDGYAVLKKIRATPALQDTRVVAVTANVTPQDVQRVRLAGFDGFIGKPIDPVRFPQQLKRILEGEAIWEPR